MTPPEWWAKNGRTGVLLDCGHWVACNPRLKYRVCTNCNGSMQIAGSGRHEVRQVTHVFDGEKVSEYQAYMAAHQDGRPPRLAHDVRSRQ